MFHRLPLLLGLSALAVVLSVTLTSDAQGGDGTGQKRQRGLAITSPIDCPDVPGCLDRKGSFHPYYSPVIPVSCRWRIVRLVPYYPGYCVKSRSGASWGCGGCSFDGTVAAGVGSGDYGPYSGAPTDEAYLLHLGGGGPGEGPPRTTGPADILDLKK